MNRRKFIGVSGLGIIGANSSVMAVSKIFGFNIEDKVFEILSFLDIYQTGEIDELLDKKIVIRKLEEFRKSNYLVCDDNLYWKAGDDKIIIPLQLKTFNGEIIDHILAVFKIDEDSKTNYIGNLSGFHLETIIRNKRVLSQLGGTEKIRHSVLPSTGKGKPVDLGWSYETEFGNFELSASLIEGKTSISSALYIDNDALWQNSFLSETPLLHSNSITI